MTAVQRNAELNHLLIALSRCLLQYVGECWPWTHSGQADVRRTITELVGLQRARTEDVAELLQRRNWPTEFGMYPVEFTDLHYVALDYLLRLLVDDQRRLVGDIERIGRTCADDPEAAGVIALMLAEQRETLGRLQGLAVPQPTGSAA